MRIIKSIFRIINYKTFIVTILAIASTWLCMKYHVVANLPLTLVGIAIVFPVVFSIDSAYKRRERALALLSDIKAHSLSLYQASSDWIDPKNEGFKIRIKEKLMEIYAGIRILLTSKNRDAKGFEEDLYDKLAELSDLLQEFRKFGLVAGEMSRVSQYISKIEVALESLKVIYFYRTPITLRAYSKVFIYSFPIFYGPYFVYVSQDYTPGLEFMMPVVFSFILVSLDNIQDHLENPFDQVGEDDIKFDEKEFSAMMN